MFCFVFEKKKQTTFLYSLYFSVWLHGLLLLFLVHVYSFCFISYYNLNIIYLSVKAKCISS